MCGRSYAKVNRFFHRQWARHRFEVSVQGRLPFGVLAPTSTIRQAWDIVAIILVLILSWSLPYRVAMTEGYESVGITIFDVLVDFFFLADILMNATTAYMVDDHLVFSRREIMLNYVRGWLAIDLVSSLPFDWFVFGFPLSPSAEDLLDDASLQSSELFKLVKMLKLLKLFRLTRLVRYWTKIEVL